MPISQARDRDNKCNRYTEIIAFFFFIYDFTILRGVLAIIVFIYNYPSPCICTCANHTTTHITCVSLVALFVPSVRLARDQCLARARTRKRKIADFFFQADSRIADPPTLISAKPDVAPLSLRLWNTLS